MLGVGQFASTVSDLPAAPGGRIFIIPSAYRWNQNLVRNLCHVTGWHAQALELGFVWLRSLDTPLWHRVASVSCEFVVMSMRIRHWYLLLQNEDQSPCSWALARLREEGASAQSAFQFPWRDHWWWEGCFSPSPAVPEPSTWPSLPWDHFLMVTDRKWWSCGRCIFLVLRQVFLRISQ